MTYGLGLKNSTITDSGSHWLGYQPCDQSRTYSQISASMANAQWAFKNWMTNVEPNDSSCTSTRRVSSSHWTVSRGSSFSRFPIVAYWINCQWISRHANVRIELDHR